MPAIETTDWLAIKARVDTLVTDPAMDVFEPGAIIERPMVPHILLSDVTNDPARIGINTDLPHIRSGTLMLTVQWPIALDVTHTQLKQIAGQIADHFRADTCMTFGLSRLRVTSDASALPAYVDGAYRVAVVRVPWSSL